MKAWNDFLTSLSTRGGAILILSLLCTAIVALMLHLVHHNELGNQFGTTIVTTFASFSGALLLALKGSSETSASASTGPSGTMVSVSDSGKVQAPSTTVSSSTEPSKAV